MPSQTQVEGFERDLKKLTLEHESDRQAVIVMHAGNVGPDTMTALKILCAEMRDAVFLLRIEWGLTP